MTIAEAREPQAAPLAGLHARLDLVQALRGLAAFGVLTHHIAVAIDTRFGEGFTPPGAGLGWVGVDLFFVISGFIMVWTTRAVGSGPRAAAGFWARRLLRVYPPWWVALGLTLAILFMLPALGGGERAGFWASFFLWPAEHPPILGPGWTLIYELWFYLGFGFLMLAPRRFLAPLLTLWALLVPLNAVVFGPAQNSILHVATNPLTLNFLMGAAVALVLASIQIRPNLRLAALLCAAGALGLLAGAWYVTATGWNEWTRMLACGPASALLLAGAAHADAHALARPHRALVRLGDWSYALYLTHQPIIFAVAYLAAESPLPAWAGVAVTVVLGLLLPFPVTAAIHTWIEVPSQNLGRTFAKHIEAGKRKP